MEIQASIVYGTEVIPVGKITRKYNLPCGGSRTHFVRVERTLGMKRIIIVLGGFNHLDIH